MHRALSALQFYTSHTETDVKRLHERIHLSLSTSSSLHATCLHLTGIAPSRPFQQDTVRPEEWQRFLDGHPHESIADFYGFLTSVPLLGEGDEMPLEQTTPTAVPKKRVLSWRLVLLALACFCIGALATWGYQTWAKKDVIYHFVSTKSSPIYRHPDSSTILQSADFGDAFPVLDIVKDRARIQLPDQTQAYMKASDLSEKTIGSMMTDQALLKWTDAYMTLPKQTRATDLLDDPATTWVGLGSPKQKIKTAVDETWTYESFTVHLIDDRAYAIDWKSPRLSQKELARLGTFQRTNTAGRLRISTHYQLQIIESESRIQLIRLTKRM